MKKKTIKKVGILGGTFNPIHNGHLILAENAYEQFHLDKIIFLPSGNPPHKENVSYIDSAHRCNMVRIAIEDNPHFELCLDEVLRPGTTYTADTLTAFKEQNPDCEYYFIIGADSLFTFEYWHQPEVICQHCTLLVSTREGHSSTDVDNKIIDLRAKYNTDIFRIILPDFDISSKLIRERINANRSVKYYIPDEEYAYIKKNKLYDEYKG